VTINSEAIADSLFSWLDAAGNTNTLDVDVAMSTKDKRTVKLTDHVVETGSVVTDHIVIMPEELSFELVMTQSPFAGRNAPGFAMGASNITAAGRQLTPDTNTISVRKSQFQPGGFLLLSSGLRSVISSVFGGEDLPGRASGSRSTETTAVMAANVLQASAPVDRVNATHDTLIEIMNTGLLVTVSFKGRLYIDYLLTSVELSQGPGEAGMGRFMVDLRAFRTVEGVNVVLPDPADFRALPQVKKGNVPATTPNPDPTKRAKSDAARLADADVKDAAGAAAAILGVR
jgi:hypothetical protein